MGRLTLNVLLSFAQFEREVIGERVRDKIAVSKRKGLWVGGPVPLGYRSIGKKPSCRGRFPRRQGSASRAAQPTRFQIRVRCTGSPADVAVSSSSVIRSPSTEILRTKVCPTLPSDSAPTSSVRSVPCSLSTL
jgi:hypothetical protein